MNPFKKTDLILFAFSSELDITMSNIYEENRKIFQENITKQTMLHMCVYNYINCTINIIRWWIILCRMFTVFCTNIFFGGYKKNEKKNNKEQQDYMKTFFRECITNIIAFNKENRIDYFTVFGYFYMIPY